MFFFRKGALPSHQQERDTKGASGELAGCAAGELASTHGLLIFPIFYNFPLLFVCLFLEDVIPVKLKLFDAFANVIECPTSKHTTLKKKNVPSHRDENSGFLRANGKEQKEAPPRRF